MNSDLITFHVEDSGIGIAEHAKTQIFARVRVAKSRNLSQKNAQISDNKESSAQKVDYQLSARRTQKTSN